MTYGVVRAFQVIVNTLLCSPEKAGVGGSTPSLATIIPKNLSEIWRQETGKITHGGSPTILSSCPYFPVFGSPMATIEVVGNTWKMSSEKPDVDYASGGSKSDT